MESYAQERQGWRRSQFAGKIKSSGLSVVQGKCVLEKFWWEVKLWVKTTVVLSRKLEMPSYGIAAQAPWDRSHVTCHPWLSNSLAAAAAAA